MIKDTTSILSNVFVGRQQELKQLRAYLKKAVEGNGSFVVISGEAGIGKTTLVRRFATEAVESGATFISASFDQVRSYEPYAPFLRIIEQVNASKSQTDFDIMSNPKKAVSSDDKQPKDHGLWDIESLFSLQTERGLTQQRLLSTILEMAREKVLIIALNKAHIAPLTAWKFIHYLGESIAEHKIILILTLRLDGREMQQKQGPVYADVLQRMNREGLVERIQLNSFEEKDIRTIVHKVLHRKDFSSRFVPLLHEITQGIPEQVIKSLEILQQKDIIYQQEGVWFNHNNFKKESLIKLISDEEDLKVASELKNQLSSNQKALLQYAALMNGPFDYRLLAAIIKRPRPIVVKELLNLKDRKILINLTDDTFRFKRPAFRSVFLEQIPQKKRHSLHLEIAANIEDVDCIESTEKVYLLAYHYSQTEDHSLAFQYLRRAGNRAIENFAFIEAKKFYNQALSLLNSVLEETNKVEIVQMLIRAAWLERILGDHDDSLGHCNSALELCEDETDQKMKLQILIQQGLTHFRRNEWQNAQKCFEKCLTEKKSLNQFELAMVNDGLGSIHFELAKYDISEHYYKNALTLARKLNAKQLMANILNDLGAIENVRGNRMLAVALYSQSIPLYKSLDNNFGLARIYHNIGMTYADEQNWELANEMYGKSLRVSDAMGLIPLKSITFLNRALALAHLQRFDEAREYNFKACRLLIRLKDQLGMAEYHKIQGIIDREQCDWTKAQKHLNIALKKFKNMENKLGEAETDYELGLLALAMDNHEDMILWLNKALVSYRNLGLSAKAKIVESQLDKFGSATPLTCKHI